MTITLELPPDLEAELSERAAQRGQAMSDYFLTLAEEDLYGMAEMTAQEQEEVAAILEEELAGVHSGDQGILLEDYRAEVMAEYHRETAEASQGTA